MIHPASPTTAERRLIYFSCKDSLDFDVMNFGVRQDVNASMLIAASP